MAFELFQQNRKRRNFFDNLSEESAPTDFQPSPSGYPSLVRAPGIEPQEAQAPAPIPAYGEEYLQANPRPEAPQIPAPGWKRKLLAIGLGAVAGLSRQPGAATQTAQNVLYGNYPQKQKQYQQGVEEWQQGYGMSLARERTGLARAKFARPPRPPGAAGTITTDKGIMQWNPENQRFDIPAGMAQEPAGRRAGLWEETFIKEHGRPPTLEEVQAHEQSVRAPIPAPATKGQLAAAENRKNTALRRLEAEYRWTVTEEGSFYVNPRTRERLTQDEFRKLKQQIQDDFEAELEALGRTPKPFEYPSGPSTSPTQGGEDPLKLY